MMNKDLYTYTFARQLTLLLRFGYENRICFTVFIANKVPASSLGLKLLPLVSCQILRRCLQIILNFFIKLSKFFIKLY